MQPAPAFRRLLAHPATAALARSRLFWLGLAVKLLAGAFLASPYLSDLFVPFVNGFVESGGANPWELALLREPRSFPYPPLMLLLLAGPRWLFSPVVAPGLQTVTPLHLLAARLPLLAADLGIAWLLAFAAPHRARAVVRLYWLSPVVFYVTYWHGQLDLLPTAVFLGSLLLLRRGHWLLAAAALGAALATKSHLLAAVPFVAVYAGRQFGVVRTVAAAGLTVAVYAGVVGPYLPSPAFRHMVFENSEQVRAISFQLPVGNPGPTLLLAPLALAGLWLRFAGYPKQNADLLAAYLGIAFGVFVALAPPQPGYALWALPLVIAHLGRDRLALAVYSVAHLLYFALGPESDTVTAWRLVLPADVLADRQAAWQAALANPSMPLVRNLLFTVMVAAMASLVLALYRNGVRSNRVYRARTRPMLIGLAGDSGAGKDETCRLFADAVGAERALVISGDDYHRWPRGHAMYQVYTHLDARANDLSRQHDHAIAIAAGRAVLKGEYDHASGRFTEQRPVDPRQYVVFAGLHALAAEGQRRLYELTVFLDPDEGLRRAWKVQRDGRERGRSADEVLASLDERAADRAKFILPQRDEAEVVVRFTPAGDGLRLEVVARNSFGWLAFAERLAAEPKLTVDHDPLRDARTQRLAVSGDIDAAAVQRIAQAVVPNLEEVAASPRFHGGLNGCLQLVLLACVSDKLRWADPTSQEGMAVV